MTIFKSLGRFDIQVEIWSDYEKSHSPDFSLFMQELL